MSEARNYFTRHPDIVPAEQSAYYAKIEKNQDDGWKALSSGEYPLFKGWSVETSGRTFDTILELDEPSQQRVIESVVKPLKKLAEAHNISAIYPGRGDGPLHVVLQPGRFTNLAPEQINTIRDWLLSDNSHLNRLSKILEGLTLHHDTLVIAAPTVYICAGKFDEEQGGIFRARKIIEKIINHALGNLKTSEQQVEGTFTPNDYHDIFHSSSMRFIEKVSPEAAKAFAQEAYSTIGEDLKRNPIEIVIARLFRGMAIDYQRKHVPQLVLP